MAFTLLHTADWHLGQKLIHLDRQVEHQKALDDLLHLLKTEQVDLLIVAGDIFDLANPPNYARRQYYDFLQRLADTPCRHTLIVGGNHDSPSMLEAPRDLLKAFDIHVIGMASENPKQQIIPLYDQQGQLEAVIAAVPFLRDRDLRSSVLGETADDRIAGIQEGIRSHYRNLAEQIQPFQEKEIPLITTGHLYAKGAQAGTEQTNIYLGDRENMAAADFPDCFHYVALGHLHRAQPVNQNRRVRYSGSLIPLSFSEVKDEKSVTLVRFGRNLSEPEIKLLPIPQYRSLKTLEGSLDDIAAQLKALARDRPKDRATDWIEVILHLDKPLPNVHRLLSEMVESLPLELLKIRLLAGGGRQESEPGENHPQLEELSPLEVFRKKCHTAGDYSSEELEALEKTFLELRQWMEQEEP